MSERGTGADTPNGGKPLVYVSGPITRDPFGCVRNSMPAFKWLMENGCVPFMPQWTVIAEMVEHLDYETWMAFDLDVIRHCAAIIRLPGDSPGADRECEFAATIGVPVYQWDSDYRRAALLIDLTAAPGSSAATPTHHHTH